MEWPLEVDAEDDGDGKLAAGQFNGVGWLTGIFCCSLAVVESGSAGKFGCAPVVCSNDTRLSSLASS